MSQEDIVVIYSYICFKISALSFSLLDLYIPNPPMIKEGKSTLAHFQRLLEPSSISSSGRFVISRDLKDINSFSPLDNPQHSSEKPCSQGWTCLHHLLRI